MCVSVTTQVRFAHTDLQTPDFTAYRRDSTKNPNRQNKTTADRNSFTYLLVGGKHYQETLDFAANYNWFCDCWRI